MASLDLPPPPDPGLDEVARLVTGELAASPSAVCAASLRSEAGVARLIGCAGRLTYDPEAPPAEKSTIYDLASVTKPIVALAFARLERRGVLRRDEVLGDALPLVRGTATAAVPLDLLLSHRAGLQAHIRLFAPLLEGKPVVRDASILAAASSRRDECAGEPPAGGFPPVYSDMGYLLVGAAMEARTGLALDRVVEAEVLGPLGLSGRIGSARQLAAARADFARMVAPTEDLAFRGGVVRGLVHDENAFALSFDALSGHAGLFGDAAAVLAIGEAILASARDASDFLDAAELEPLVRARPGGSLLAGFDRKSGETPSAGTLVGPRTFGHLGFTGTSLWIDPDSTFVGVLLTNRVHPSRDHIAIRKARPAVYDAMFRAVISSTPPRGRPKLSA
jgi:CubicO group peptidase (beta-lactamase class C family)